MGLVIMAASKSNDSYSIRIPKFSLKQNSYTPVLMVILLVAVFFLGRLTAQVEYLKKGTTATPTITTQAPNQPAAPTTDLNKIKALFSDGSIHFGDTNRKNLFVEFSDPSCPFCHIAGGLNPELNQQSGSQFTLVSQGGKYVPPVEEMRKLVDSGNASFVWIYFPGHGNGEMGTKALYCAYEQGKFWEAHDKLMSNAGYSLLNNTVKNDTTKTADLVNFIGNVVDTGKLTDCLNSGKYNNKIASDTNLGSTLGVQGTPGFYINSTYISGAMSWENMKTSVK